MAKALRRIVRDLMHDTSPEDVAGMEEVFLRGFEEGLGDFGMTYDNDSESPRSRAYDFGRTIRREMEGIE
jgi:hypothetical protein